jgi:hypothetical protein
MKNPNQLVRRIEAVRLQLERIPPPPKTTDEEAEEEQLWDRAWDLYEQGGVPRPGDDPRLFSYLDTITKYGPVFEDMINRGIVIVPTDDDVESPPSRELATP